MEWAPWMLQTPGGRIDPSDHETLRPASPMQSDSQHSLTSMAVAAAISSNGPVAYGLSRRAAKASEVDLRGKPQPNSTPTSLGTKAEAATASAPAYHLGPNSPPFVVLSPSALADRSRTPPTCPARVTTGLRTPEVIGGGAALMMPPPRVPHSIRRRAPLASTASAATACPQLRTPEVRSSASARNTGWAALSSPSDGSRVLAYPALGSAPVLSTPEPRVTPLTPPPAPCLHLDRKELEEDVRTALEWGSEPLLSMTLLRSHCLKCSGDHALHEAINLQHVRAVALLLAAPVRPDIEEPCHGWSPLWRAIRVSTAAGDAGHKMAELLLQHGAQAGMPGAEFGDTPLHEAAAHGRTWIFSLLFAYGASANAANLGGCTPLHAACHRFVAPHLRTVELLLAHGADPRRRNNAGLLPHESGRSCGGGPDAAVQRRLLREVRWLDRRSVVLAWSRGGGHILCRLPLNIVEAIVQHL